MERAGWSFERRSMRIFLKLLKLSALGVVVAGAFLLVTALFLDRAGMIPLRQIRNKFRFSPERISREAALRDSEDFFSSLERVHPDVSAKLGLDGYSALKKRTLDEVTERSLASGRIKVRDLAYILYRAAAAIGDGHTRINYIYAINTKDASKRFPPFTLASKDGKLIIDRSTDESLAGAEIAAINGVPFREFIGPVMERLSGETEKFKAFQFVRDQWFWWDFSALFSGFDSFEAALRLPDGAVKKVNFNASGPERVPSVSMNIQGSGAALDIFHKTGIGWFKYGSFENSASQRAEIANIFKRLKQAGVKDLVIDLRGNVGGDSAMGDLIFSYLTRAKVVQLYGKLKISEELIASRPALKELKPHVGELVNSGSGGTAYPMPAAFFEGKVYLLVDNGSYSSSNSFAAAFREYGLGKIIGYETGEPLVAFGNALKLSLRRSGITYMVSVAAYSPRKPLPGDDKHGLLPDLTLNDAKLRPYGGSVQAFVLDHIVKER